jgi:hypothetical protein
LNGGEIQVTIQDILAFVRGECVLLLYDEIGNYSIETITKPLTLLVALDGNYFAWEKVQLDDGESFNFAGGSFIYRSFRVEKGYLVSRKKNKNSFFPSFKIILSEA